MSSVVQQVSNFWGIPEESTEVDHCALVEDDAFHFKETSLNNMVIIARSKTDATLRIDDPMPGETIRAPCHRLANPPRSGRTVVLGPDPARARYQRCNLAVCCNFPLWDGRHNFPNEIVKTRAKRG